MATNPFPFFSYQCPPALPLDAANATLCLLDAAAFADYAGFRAAVAAAPSAGELREVVHGTPWQAVMMMGGRETKA